MNLFGASDDEEKPSKPKKTTESLPLSPPIYLISPVPSPRS